MSMTEFTIAHISDLHFSEGTDKSNPSHCHSIEYLIGLEKRLPPSPHYSRLMVRGAVAAIPDTSATPMPLSRSLTAAAGPYVLCWEWSGGRRTS